METCIEVRGNWSLGVDLLASGFIQNEDVAWAKEGAGKAEELLLAVRQVDLVNVCLEIPLFLDRREELDALESCQDFAVGMVAGWIGVQSDAALEEEGVL